MWHPAERRNRMKRLVRTIMSLITSLFTDLFNEISDGIEEGDVRKVAWNITLLTLLSAMLIFLLVAFLKWGIRNTVSAQ